MWRNAIGAQMLTPAPDVGAVTWKRVQMRGRQWSWSSVTDMQVELALAADTAWLEQHPTKKSLLAAAQVGSHKSRKPENSSEEPPPNPPAA